MVISVNFTEAAIEIAATLLREALSNAEKDVFTM
jgi:hypothetical protein